MQKKKFKIVLPPSDVPSLSLPPPVETIILNPQYQFRLFDYQTNDIASQFRIQMFGVNEEGKTCSIFVNNIKPFFYVRLPVDMGEGPQYTDTLFYAIKDLLNQKMKGDFLEAKFVPHYKLYEFTGKIQFPFAQLSFRNYRTFQHVKKMIENKQPLSNLELYESKIPPMLRYFHIHKICPSGWIQIDKSLVSVPNEKSTTCDYEFIVESTDIVPLPNKETPVPFKIASFDIEASSSHGDFPVPTKDYKRLASQIVDAFQNTQKKQALDVDTATLWLKKRIHSAFSIGESYENIDKVFPKQPVQLDKNFIKLRIQQFMTAPMEHIHNDVSLKEGKQIWKISKLFEKQQKI